MGVVLTKNRNFNLSFSSGFNSKKSDLVPIEFRVTWT